MDYQRFETLLVHLESDHVMVITLNRPDSLNAFNSQMSRELVEIFEEIGMDSDTLRCIILTGKGDRAFCAGADLKERNNMSDEQWSLQHRIFERMVRAIRDCPIPTIGAINGYAYGGGCEIAGLLDFLYASQTASFALPETTLGIMPGAGGSQTLSRAVGERRAKELIFTAQSFSADDAYHWGLVNQVLPPSELVPTALKTAETIATNAPFAVQRVKQSIHRGMQMSLSDALMYEIESYYRTIPTRDRMEGVLAFNEKRKPVFEGR
ncbi:MAG: enoyl-CoA hydratase-related protein [Gammaproteobacteria bacterium]|nr:enoyl-CoA hydratase-related protein [Gammaproteobacteria bacterium]